MHTTTAPTLIDGKLPVFVFPSSLTFYSDDQTSHKQVLTLYNPYDFHLRFKVLCTVPRRYAVVDSEGSIKPRCCVDIVVRHKVVSINNEGVKDKFRIQVSEYGQKTIIGHKDITAVLYPTKDRSSADDTFQSLPPPMGSPAMVEIQTPMVRANGRMAMAATSPSMVVVVAAILCIGALMLPTHGEENSSLPRYLFLSTNQKLIAAYILGLVTMAIIRS